MDAPLNIQTNAKGCLQLADAEMRFEVKAPLIGVAFGRLNLSEQPSNRPVHETRDRIRNPVKTALASWPIAIVALSVVATFAWGGYLIWLAGQSLVALFRLAAH